MKDNFARSLAHVLVHEGGFVDHPQDPGGATNKGVTLAVFQRFFGAAMTTADLKAITDDQLQDLYKTDYWDKCKCDALPDGVDYVVFDQAVNSGPRRSAKWLQAVIGVAVDGGIGPNTIAAASTFVALDAVNQMCDVRLAFLRGIRNGSQWATFGRGWQARVDGVRAHGTALVTGEQARPVADAEDDVAPFVDFEIARRGSDGLWVRRLQQALRIEADGVFGAATEAALKAHQEEAGLTADGIAGRKTFQSFGLVA